MQRSKGISICYKNFLSNNYKTRELVVIEINLIENSQLIKVVRAHTYAHAKVTKQSCHVRIKQSLFSKIILPVNINYKSCPVFGKINKCDNSECCNLLHRQINIETIYQINY